MKLLTVLPLLTVLAATAPAAAQPAAPRPNYASASAWLCLPGRSDVCSEPLATAALNPNGFGPVANSRPAKDPPVDCFYVYPTVSGDRGMNSDLVAAEERGAARSQFARFASVCKTYAPIYRQMTLSTIAAGAIGMNVIAPGRLAYADVLAAWKTYLARHNRGRPFVLIGHSQGTIHLIELIAREIETNPALHARMKLAMLAGFNVLVPQGRLVGGSFKRTPLCSRPAETGCVIAWVSFRENNPPPPGAIFGFANAPGMTVACVNPARPGSRSWERLDSIWNARWNLPVAGGPIRWSSAGPPPAPFLRTDGLASGRCVNAGPRGYLSIRVNANPRDKRTDRVYGEVGLLGMFVPGWGMHLADIAAVQGDLIRRVEELGQAR